MAFFQYQPLRSIGTGGDFRGPAPQAPVNMSASGTQWAPVAGASAAGRAMQAAAQTEAFQRTAQAGIGATADVLNTNTSGFANVGMAGIGALADMRETDAMYALGKKRIDAMEPDNFSRFAGTALGLGQVGLGFHMMNRPTPQIVYRSGGTA